MQIIFYEYYENLVKPLCSTVLSVFYLAQMLYVYTMMSMMCRPMQDEFKRGVSMRVTRPNRLKTSQETIVRFMHRYLREADCSTYFNLQAQTYIDIGFNIGLCLQDIHFKKQGQ